MSAHGCNRQERYDAAAQQPGGRDLQSVARRSARRIPTHARLEDDPNWIRAA